MPFRTFRTNNHPVHFAPFNNAGVGDRNPIAFRWASRRYVDQSVLDKSSIICGNKTDRGHNPEHQLQHIAGNLTLSRDVRARTPARMHTQAHVHVPEHGRDILMNVYHADWTRRLQSFHTRCDGTVRWRECLSVCSRTTGGGRMVFVCIPTSSPSSSSSSCR